MTPEGLLLECETLTYGGRIRLMVQLGQQAGSNSNIRETLATFARGDVYQRVLAMHACFGSHDSDQIFRAISDPSRLVRKLALTLAARVLNEVELQSALELLPLDLKMVLMRSLSKYDRRSSIDVYLETLVTRGDRTFQSLLPFGTRAIMSRYFEQVEDSLDLLTWGRFGRNYPKLVMERLQSQAAGSTTIDPQLVSRINAVIPHITKSAPDETLEFIKALIPIIPLARLSLQPLVEKRPNAMADLVRQTKEQSTIHFGKVAHRLELDQLIALFTRYPNNIDTYRFARLRPQERLAIYNACERGWRNAEGILAYSIVEALPAPQRLQEGRRHLAQPALGTRPTKQFPYAAFLPWDEVRSLLDTPLRSPDADLRGAAIKALIITTRYQREHLAEVLQLIRNRRNEQDPVRNEMLTALAALPHGIWQSTHLEGLAQIIRDALDAKDLSYLTVRVMERLIVHLFPFHPQWSAEQIAIIYRERGNVSVYGLEKYLSDADVRRITPVLTPILQSWQQRENEQLLATLAYALGKRLSAFDELAKILETTLMRTKQERIANSIVQMFQEHRRREVYLLIPRLLREDKSAIVLPAVNTYLHRYRQDLLTPFLGQHAYTGRFSTGNTRIVLQFDGGFSSWTPKQQEIFVQTLLNVVGPKDQNRASYELVAAIKYMASMTFIDFAPLIQFANDERLTLRDSALLALGKLDAGQGIPTLIEALNDERARVAIYALRNALLALPPEEALALLINAPGLQVTVAKEIVRLIGELGTEHAYRELVALDQEPLHRDVRVALLRALWDYTDRAEVWEIFARAAQAADRAVARGVVHVPADGLSSLAQKRLSELTAILLSHPEVEVRMATLTWRSQHPVSDNEQILFTHLLALLNSDFPDEYMLAAKAVFAIYTGSHAPLVGEAVRRLRTNRRALQFAINTFSSMLRNNRGFLLPTARTILAALADDRLTLTLRVELIIRGLPGEEIVSELVKLTPILHADALMKAQNQLEQLYLRPDIQLLELEKKLAASEDERLRRLAFSILIAQSHMAEGWTEARIERLKAYQSDSSSLVAEAAQFTFAV